MNATVKRILGEANYHSPEERARLDQAKQGEPPPGEGQERSGAPEEKAEVRIANTIIKACDNFRHGAVHGVRGQDPLDTLFRIRREAIELLKLHGGY